MPFTPIHGLIALVVFALLFKEFRLGLIAFVSGMLPDLDGIAILFDKALYYEMHHELFHPPIYGIILAIPVALVLEKYWKIDRKKTFIAFAGGFFLHSFVDLFFTNWPVKMLWPLSSYEFSYPFFIGYSRLIIVPIALAGFYLLFKEWERVKSIKKNKK